jgi:hypothetical protein
MMARLILKRAEVSRPSGQWRDDNFNLLEDGVIVGRISLAPAAPQDRQRMWTSGHNGDPPLPPSPIVFAGNVAAHVSQLLDPCSDLVIRAKHLFVGPMVARFSLASSRWLGGLRRG